MALEGDRQERLEENTKIPRFMEISNLKDSITDFKEIIKDIDNENLEDHHNHHLVVMEIIQNLNKKDVDSSKVG